MKNVIGSLVMVVVLVGCGKNVQIDASVRQVDQIVACSGTDNNGFGAGYKFNFQINVVFYTNGDADFTATVNDTTNTVHTLASKNQYQGSYVIIQGINAFFDFNDDSDAGSNSFSIKETYNLDNGMHHDSRVFTFPNCHKR